MSSLEALQPNTSVRGILPNCLVTVVSVQWFGSEALELTYKNPTGRVANELLYRHDEARLEVVEQGPYQLSNAEAQLCKAATDYMREEFNRAEALQNDKRAGTVSLR